VEDPQPTPDTDEPDNGGRRRRRVMPAKSQAQRRYLHAKFGKSWAKKHHFDTKGKLPARAKGKR